MTGKIKIPDKRSNISSDYPPEAPHVRLGQMKRSWPIGVSQRIDGNIQISFEDGLTWGSIGQILGYLLGQVNESYQDDLYEKLEQAFRGTDRWVSGENERVE